MTDPRALPPEALADRFLPPSMIAKIQAHRDSIAPDDGIEPHADALWLYEGMLLAHAAYLAERVAEAERAEQHARSLIDYREKGLRERIAALEEEIRTLTKQQDKLLRTCDDLRTQLARERADHAATVRAQNDYAIGLQEIVATAHRERDFAVDRVERFAQLCELAAPDRGASAVLAAADTYVTEADAINETFQANPSHTLNFGPEIEARKTFIAAVRTWRARRRGGEK